MATRMGAPHKMGIDYIRLYPLKKLRKYIRVQYGHKAHSMFVDMLIYIAQNDGYYFPTRDSDLVDFFDEWGYDEEGRAIMNGLIKLLCTKHSDSFFNFSQYRKNKILTNYSLQEGYLKATKRRRTLVMCKEYTLPEVSDVMQEYRNPEKNHMRVFFDDVTKLTEVHWIKKNDSDIEEEKKTKLSESQNPDFFEENLKKFELQNERKKDSGITLWIGDASQTSENKEVNDLMSTLSTDNEHTMSTLSPQVQEEVKAKAKAKEEDDSLQKFSISSTSKEVYPTDYGGGSEGDQKNEDNEDKNPKTGGAEKPAKKKKYPVKDEDFKLQLTDSYTAATGIPYISTSHEENSAIAGIVKKTVALVKLHNPGEGEMDRRKMVFLLRQVYDTIFLPKNWDKLPDYLKKLKGYTLIFKHFDTIVSTIILPKNQKTNYNSQNDRPQKSAHRDTNGTERHGSATKLADVMSGTKFEPELSRSENKKEPEKTPVARSYTTEELLELSEEDWITAYSQAIKDKKDILIGMLKSVAEQKGYMSGIQ